MSFKITKASGEQEEFDINKFRNSLQKAGADKQTIEEIAKRLAKRTDLRSTKDIYRFAMQELKKKKRPVAAKYNIKQALFQLGPSGYPFEHFVAEIFKNKGYQTETGTIVKGFCVDHEVDLVAHKDKEHVMAECKFHNSQGNKTDVKVTLYVMGRFIDVENYLKKTDQHKVETYECWVITNTKFTTEAIKFANCSGIDLLGWGYPKKGNIADLIDQYDLFPITVLTTLNTDQKKQLIKQGFVLCRNANQYRTQLKNLGLNDKQVNEVVAESEGVCEL